MRTSTHGPPTGPAPRSALPACPHNSRYGEVAITGDPTPSRQDIELTHRLREVGDMCGISVLDHVVVGWEGYASLAERGWR